MRVVGAGVVAVLCGALAWPQLVAYRGERRVRAGEDEFRVLATRPAGAARLERLRAVADAADAIAPALPGDPRPRILAGSARLLARDADAALASYRAALRTGERAEIDLDLARAHLLARDTDAAQAALVRAGWISPTLVHDLPKAPRRSLLREIKGLARALKAGRLPAPPELAAADRE